MSEFCNHLNGGFLWENFMNKKISRLPEVQAMYSLSRSTILQRVSNETLPPPISLGGKRAVAWVNAELEAVLDLMITGASINEIKDLVKELVEKRQNNKKEMIMLNSAKTTYEKNLFVSGLIQGLIHHQGVGVITGEDGYSNVCLAVELASHVAHCVSWHGRSVCQSDVVYCRVGEFHEDIFDMSLTWKRYRSVTAVGHFYVSSMPLNLLDENQSEKWTTSLAQYLLGKAREQHPGLIFIEVDDYLLNDNKKKNKKRIHQMIKNAKNFCNETKTSVIFVFNKGDRSKSINARSVLFDVDLEVNVRPKNDGVSLSWKTDKYRLAMHDMNIDLSCAAKRNKDLNASQPVTYMRSSTANFSQSGED